MDGTTEPIIAVIGHPIAGNPTQLALERALRSLKMDWRVVSFDVRPADIDTALDGFAVIGVAGVIIDPTVAEAASRWYSAARQPPHPAEAASEDAGDAAIPEPAGDDLPIDCLYRDADGRFVGSHEQRAWVDSQIDRFDAGDRIWMGDTLDGAPLARDALPAEATRMPPDPESLPAAGLMVIAGNAASQSLEVEDWPRNDGSTLILDLTDGHPQREAMRRLGYHLVTELERQIATLQGCLRRWTGQDASAEVIRDAIEEYRGV